MRAVCLILTLLISLSAGASSTARKVVCIGNVQAQLPNKAIMDQGVARVRFDLVDKAVIKNIDVAAKFKKIPAQSLEAFESRAIKRGVASGRYRADLFNIGNNGACQIALGYQADLIQKAGTQNSWGVFVMGCGMHSVLGNLKCQMK